MMLVMPDREDDERPAAAPTVTTAELLTELGRRLRIRFGRVEILFHDGRPSPRVTVEHRVQRGLDD